MKSLIRYVGVGIIAAVLATSASFAGECCKQAAAKVKAGELCPKCMKADAHECCKKAAEAALKEKDTKPCAKCSKKEEKKS
jgi:hypothetical protein